MDASFGALLAVAPPLTLGHDLQDLDPLNLVPRQQLLILGPQRRDRAGFGLPLLCDEQVGRRVAVDGGIG